MACASGPLSVIDAELLIVPWFKDEAASAVPGLDAERHLITIKRAIG